MIPEVRARSGYLDHYHPNGRIATTANEKVVHPTPAAMWLVKERNVTSSIVAGWKRHAFRPVNLVKPTPFRDGRTISRTAVSTARPSTTQHYFHRWVVWSSDHRLGQSKGAKHRLSGKS